MNDIFNSVLPPPPPDVASMAITAAKARAQDPLRNWTPPPREDCPICLLPLPLRLRGQDKGETSYYSCCCQEICNGCAHELVLTNMKDAIKNGGGKKNFANARELSSTCPFCRDKLSDLSDAAYLAKDIKRSEAGDARAMWRVGNHHFEGNMGLKENKTEGLKWLKRAAEGGSAGATNALAVYYGGGVGVERDMMLSLQYCKKAAEQGRVQSFAMVGCLLWDLDAIEDAIINFRKAAICGFAPCIDITLPFFEDGFITKEEYAFTLRAFQAASSEMKSEARTTHKELVKRQDEDERWKGKSPPDQA